MACGVKFSIYAFLYEILPLQDFNKVQSLQYTVCDLLEFILSPQQCVYVPYVYFCTYTEGNIYTEYKKKHLCD